MDGSAMVCRHRRGFTLVELLVSMAVLLLVVGLLSQVVRNATTSIQRSTKGMDSNQLATVALDRIGNSIAGMIASGQGTLVAVKNAQGSDGLAMITNGRVRSRQSSANISVTSFTEVRLGTHGYCVINTVDPDLSPISGGSSAAVPMLSWGDGTIKWPTPSPSPASSPAGAAYVQDDPLQALYQAAQDVSKQATGTGTAGNMLEFSPLSRGIFRFEICFLLSDGSLVSDKAPPLNKHLIVGGVAPLAPVVFDSAAFLPLAFSASDSNDATNGGPGGQPLYVRAVVVGIASLDVGTQRILGGNQLTKLASIQTLPKTTDSHTPSQTWDITSSASVTYQTLRSNFPAPVLQNIRFSQRYYYVH